MWLDDSKRTRSIKASVVERWLIISRYRLQAPFHSWFLFCQDVKFRERAQKSIVEVRVGDLNTTEFQFETTIHTKSQSPACVCVCVYTYIIFICELHFRLCQCVGGKFDRGAFRS